MLIQLAPEYWMEIFDFLIQHRRAVAEKFSQFGDRQFSDLCQHWLHERIKNVQLDCLNIRSNGMMEASSNGASSGSWEERNWEVENRTNVHFAQVPMPQNIVGFKEIEINYLDSDVLTFVRRMSSLFTKICLTVYGGEGEADAKNAMIAFEHLLPFFNGITEIYPFGSRPFFEHFRKQFPSAVLNRVLQPIVFGVTEGLLPDDYVLFIANLLHTKRENGDEPRRCTVYGMGNGVTALAMSLDQLNQLLAIIRENFLAATTPARFIFSFRPSSLEPFNDVQQFRIQNGNTGEQLVVWKNGVGTMLHIVRCPCVDVNAWIQQQELKQLSDSVITIFRPKIGELNGEEDSKEEKEEYEEGNDDQPGSSEDGI